MKRTSIKIAAALILVILVGVIAVKLLRGGDEQAATFRTTPVKKGDLLLSISATGTVEPEEVIDIGAQVAGQIMSFGQDIAGKPVDYGSVVQAGMVLAQIDPAVYAAQDAETDAQVASAQASIQRGQADLGQMKAKLIQAQRDWRRARSLGPSEALSQASYDGYQSAYETAVANLAVGQAAILQAQASLAQAQAVRLRTKRNLGYCTIISPVDGVIIDRRVNIGQTVMANLNAPSLFLIAKDLRRMQVWVAVNEADIGRIKPGLPITFTVDAFPGETFEGRVGKVRLNASMTQNVVTYTVEIITDNSNGRLLPYLTANVRFELERRTQVLMVPNAALRFTPTAEQIASQYRPAAQERAKRKEQAEPSGRQTDRGLVWSLEGSLLRPVKVLVGITDGTMTELRGEGLAEGLEVVTGVQSKAEAAAAESTNPFAPKIPRGGGSGRPAQGPPGP